MDFESIKNNFVQTAARTFQNTETHLQKFSLIRAGSTLLKTYPALSILIATITVIATTILFLKPNKKQNTTQKKISYSEKEYNKLMEEAKAIILRNKERQSIANTLSKEKEDQIQQLETQVQQLKTQLSELKTTHTTALQEQQQKLSEATLKMQKEMENANRDKASRLAYAAKDTFFQKRVTAHENKISDLETELKELKTSHTTALTSAHLNKVKDQQAQQKIVDLENKIAQLEKTLEQKQAELDAAQSLESKLGCAPQNLEDVCQDISTIVAERETPEAKTPTTEPVVNIPSNLLKQLPGLKDLLLYSPQSGETTEEQDNIDAEFHEQNKHLREQRPLGESNSRINEGSSSFERNSSPTLLAEDDAEKSFEDKMLTNGDFSDPGSSSKSDSSSSSSSENYNVDLEADFANLFGTGQ